MNQIKQQPSLSIDRGATMKGPRTDNNVDADALASVQFHHDFAMTCTAEARTFPVGSPEHRENLLLAKEFLDEALAAIPNKSEYHFSRGIVCAEMGDVISAVSSLRNAVMYDPSKVIPYMMVLQHGSQEVNTTSPGVISSATLKIQSSMSEGNFEAAFADAHTEINRSIQRETILDLWQVQLMRVAAMQIGAERTYVDTLTALEQRGFLDAQEPEYLPVSYTITEQMRQEMQEEASSERGILARSRFWDDLKIRQIQPIDKTAVQVGPRAKAT